MSKKIQRRRVSRVIAAVALFVPSFALASAKGAAVEKPATPDPPVVPRAKPLGQKIAPAGSLLRDIVDSFARSPRDEASPFEPPGRPPDRPPVDPPGHNDPPNPPGRPPDRPPDNSNRPDDPGHGGPNH